MRIIEFLNRASRSAITLGYLYTYRRKFPKILKRIREKEKIKVLYVLSDLSLWKTEDLYRAMLCHPRFEPIIGVTLLTCDTPSESVRKYESLLNYLNSSHYQYKELTQQILLDISPDITFYQQAYLSIISESIDFNQIVKNESLLCDVHYSFRTLAPIKKNNWIVDLNLYRFCWHMYLENELSLEYAKISLLKGKNMRVTGVPVQDNLIKSKNLFNDPWKPQNKRKKRIIYAPHHSLPGTSPYLNLSCFLDVCDFMFELAEFYKDEVQFAFKPHPFLRRKLINLWGEKKTEEYYFKWTEMENCQLVEDSYIELFKHSDALMHDCDSFTLEYCFMQKPIMYLIDSSNIEKRKKDLNSIGKQAFELHEYGFTKEDILAFVNSVIQGVDCKKEMREKFYKDVLTPPNGKSACENIIDTIISEVDSNDE